MFSFISIEFAISFIAFFCVYWAFRQKPKWQNILLIIISYLILYLMAGLIATAVLFVFSSIIFVLSVLLNTQQKYRKAWLFIGIIAVIMNLSVFKYYDFFRIQITAVLELMNMDSTGLAAHLLLPLGISYYSFQAISYLVSRYRDEMEVPRFGFLQLLMHLSFFATITAGPIARAKSAKGLVDIDGNACGLSPQIQSSKPRNILYPSLALVLIMVALIKKWWLAGWLAEAWVNPVFANPMQYHSLEILVAIYGYTLQLFLDFSGYSELMIAFALLLGFRLPVNFKAPLLAHNIRDFWNRWHISLSTWIRDYIYIPLGGSGQAFWRTQLNLLIAMVLSGIWHGSGWNFFVWGLLHGVALVLLNSGDKLLATYQGKPMNKCRNSFSNIHLLTKIIAIVITFHFVAFAFVFFRSQTFDDALAVFRALFTNYINVAWTNNPLYTLSLMLLAWVLYPWVLRLAKLLRPQGKSYFSWLFIVPLFIAFVIVLFFAPSGIPGFIYANF